MAVWRMEFSLSLEAIPRACFQMSRAMLSSVLGETERVWTSFGTSEWSEQIDLDVQSAQTRRLITDWLRSFADRGVRIVRLDAVGYVIKKAETSCFMVEPEIYEFLDWVSSTAASVGLTVLPEVHGLAAPASSGKDDLLAATF